MGNNERHLSIINKGGMLTEFSLKDLGVKAPEISHNECNLYASAIAGLLKLRGVGDQNG
ncbi:MAG: hypothetical protein ACYDEJ_01735 [Desulfitobacteriaceae bacterium]